jgi:hypothetical protein
MRRLIRTTGTDVHVNNVGGGIISVCATNTKRLMKILHKQYPEITRLDIEYSGKYWMREDDGWQKYDAFDEPLGSFIEAEES